MDKVPRSRVRLVSGISLLGIDEVMAVLWGAATILGCGLGLWLAGLVR